MLSGLIKHRLKANMPLGEKHCAQIMEQLLKGTVDDTIDVWVDNLLFI